MDSNNFNIKNLKPKINLETNYDRQHIPHIKYPKAELKFLRKLSIQYTTKSAWINKYKSGTLSKLIVKHILTYCQSHSIKSFIKSQKNLDKIEITYNGYCDLNGIPSQRKLKNLILNMGWLEQEISKQEAQIICKILQRLKTLKVFQYGPYSDEELILPLIATLKQLKSIEEISFNSSLDISKQQLVELPIYLFPLPQLQRFSINLAFEDDLNPFESILPISKCTNLEYLKIICNFNSHYQSYHLSLINLVKDLKNLQSLVLSLPSRGDLTETIPDLQSFPELPLLRELTFQKSKKNKENLENQTKFMSLFILKQKSSLVKLNFNFYEAELTSSLLLELFSSIKECSKLKALKCFDLPSIQLPNSVEKLEIFNLKNKNIYSKESTVFSNLQHLKELELTIKVETINFLKIVEDCSQLKNLSLLTLEFPSNWKFPKKHKNVIISSMKTINKLESLKIVYDSPKDPEEITYEFITELISNQQNLQQLKLFLGETKLQSKDTKIFYSIFLIISQKISLEVFQLSLIFSSVQTSNDIIQLFKMVRNLVNLKDLTLNLTQVKQMKGDHIPILGKSLYSLPYLETVDLSLGGLQSKISQINSLRSLLQCKYLKVLSLYLGNIDDDEGTLEKFSELLYLNSEWANVHYD